MTSLTKRLPLNVPAPSAGFARATESSGEVRKGGNAPLRMFYAAVRMARTATRADSRAPCIQLWDREACSPAK